MPGGVVVGLEVLLEELALVRGRRFALLANQASVTQELETSWQALSRAGCQPVRLLAPEHGLWGIAQDMEPVETEREPATGVEIVSLYGRDATTLAPPPGVLEDLEAVVVDLPDIGCRYYTFAATMALTMAACAAAGVEVIVCDRPNPLGGVELEGGPVTPSCRSFVSELPVPVRHGLTLGELALLLKTQRFPHLTLTVLPCRGWQRAMTWEETGLPWVAPSPNMPTPTTARIYPGACLVEATNLSEGRGTTRPFQLIGAPWLDGEALARALNAVTPPAFRFRATRFRPEFGKHAGQVCQGVEWHVLDRRAAGALAVGLELLQYARALHPHDFAWREAPYEFVRDVPAIDLLTGSATARQAVLGEVSLAEVQQRWEQYCQEFAQERRPFLLYPEAS
jgi:uncharacterized protein YbbC (DUF1343 family)